MKNCVKCTLFLSEKNYLIYNQKRCDLCIDKEKSRKLIDYYGINQSQFDKILLNQNGVCKLCKRPETTVNKYGVVTQLCVDHDHNCCPGRKSCGKCVRGLLCQSCNRLLGHIEKNQELIFAMFDYLDKNSQ